MDSSQTEFLRLMEKSGLPYSEAAFVAKNSGIAFSSFRNEVARMIPMVGRKEAKLAATETILLSSLGEDNEKNFLLIKAYVSVFAYSLAKDANLEIMHSNLSIKDKVQNILSDETSMEKIKAQFIESRARGMKKGIWSSIFG